MTFQFNQTKEYKIEFEKKNFQSLHINILIFYWFIITHIVHFDLPNNGFSEF